MAPRVIQVGTGGRGETWCSQILPPHVDAGRIEPVAAVDVNQEALENAKTGLGLTDEACFTDYEDAFSATAADCCVVATPPAFHEDVIDSAVAAGLHVLTEKPIAETFEASRRIAAKVADSDVKMGVAMNHRFRDDVWTLRKTIDDVGHIDRIDARFVCSNQKESPWDAFRVEMDHPLLVDCGIHHLDIVAGIVDAPCERVYSETWNPEWSPFSSESNAMVTMAFEDGVRASYEAAMADSTPLNCWGDEYIRVTGEDATVVMSEGGVVKYSGDDRKQVPIADRTYTGAQLIVEQFCDWLEGGEPVETTVEDNLASMAIVEAAIASGQRNDSVEVKSLLEDGNV